MAATAEVNNERWRALDLADVLFISVQSSSLGLSGDDKWKLFTVDLIVIVVLMQAVLLALQ